MTNTTQEPTTAAWKTVQDKGGERASRIRDIVKEAASEVVTELKDGTADLQQLSRKSLAEMIAQLKAKEAEETAAEAEIPADNDTVALVEVDPQITEQPLPTWRQILRDLLGLVDARKGVWTHQLLTRLEQQMAKFDADMTAEHGERYGNVSRIVNRLRTVVRWAAEKAAGKPETPAETATPVTIEVVDQDPQAPSASEGAAS